MKALCIALLMLLAGCSCSYLRPMVGSEVGEADKSAVVPYVDDSGACTAWHLGQGKWLTAAHCTAKAVGQYLIIDGKNQPVQIVREDTRRDLALLYLPNYDGPALRLYTGEELEDGEPIASLGYPGLFYGRFAITPGQVDAQPELQGISYIFSRGIAYRGSSGGPVISLMNGEVVGMIDAVIMHKDDLTGQNMEIGLVVRYNTVNEFLDSK